MSKIIWDAVGEKHYETGVDHGVLYRQNETGVYSTGVPWNGLTAVTETPSGAEPTDLWADNIKYATLRSAEAFGMTIEAYTYPAEFAECDGSAEPVDGVYIGQQNREPFGFCYRTMEGNDATAGAENYKLHLIYGCTASPSEKAYSTINDSPEAINFSWEVTTVPVNVTGFKPTACMVIDAAKVAKEKMTALEEILYGSEQNPARLPLPDEVIALIGGTNS